MIVRSSGTPSPVTGGQWHPSEKESVLTGAMDGTMRLWDLEGGSRGLEDRLQCGAIFKLKSQRGVRVPCTSCAWDPDGDLIAGGAEDGSVQLWKPGRSGNGRPDFVLRHEKGGHAGGSAVTSVAFAPSGRLVASRADDDCVCVWDLRKASQGPVHKFGNLESLFATSNVCWSPDGNFLCAGTSVRKGDKGQAGRLKFFSAQAGGEAVLSLQVASEGASLVQCAWHRELKQVLCGTSTGELRLLYDPLISKHGALLSAGRVPRKAKPSDESANVDPPSAYPGIIINPPALPLFQVSSPATPPPHPHIHTHSAACLVNPPPRPPRALLA